MFYSQFILAKKGPLGTIWIAAHLERKLRKNQVADTDIGVSVDSILCPDVPIALRLSSHLLLGVVRIYSRKVNYLFDDCSDTLLKIKQAFRSAAVDLPPEESKAPYHSITLPETFDLDDFELPDNDIFQGNFVDHHISSREQITLQDSMEGVAYSTSKFGLDERFGDGDASGLDLDEELFLDKISTARHASERSDPQASVGPMTPLKQDEHPETRTVNSGARVDGVDDYVDLMDYAQAPCTPGLVEEPNLSNVQEVSACDEHLESEYHLGESTTIENVKNNIYGVKQEVNWSSNNNTNSDVVLPEENGHQPDGLHSNLSKPHGESPIGANTEHVQEESTSGSKPPTDLLSQVKSVDPSSETFCMEDLRNEDASKDNNSSLIDKPSDHHQSPNEIGLEKSASEISGIVEISNDWEKSLPDASDLPLKSHDGSSPQFRETQPCHEPADPISLNLDVHEKAVSSETLFFRPCNSNMEPPDLTSGGVRPTEADIQSDITALATSEREETVMIGKGCSGIVNSEETSKQNHIPDHTLQEDIYAASTEPDTQVMNASAHDKPMENQNTSAEVDMPAPEKLLSVPEDLADQCKNILPEASPAGLDEGDAGSKIISGKKRSFTESTLTEQSLNSVESSRLVRFKRTTESVPDDDDLLSSILVGRSSVLKVKPTPRLSEATSTKRTRSAPRTGAPKRKVLMDDTMVLHGDKIRQQLTSTEDIRRVRKKAPCTRAEISMLQKEYLDDDIFLDPLFTGMSIELISLHSQMGDLSGITIYKSDLTGASLEIDADSRLPSENVPSTNDKDISLEETVVRPELRSNDLYNDGTLTSAAEPHLTSQNIENAESLDIASNKVSGIPNVAENSDVGITDLLSLDKDGEVAKSSESPLPSINRTNEVEEINVGIDNYEEQTEPTSDVTGVETSDKNDDALGPSIAVVQMNPITETSETNASVNADTSAGLPDQEKDAPLDYAVMDVDDGQAINRDDLTEKDGDINDVFETEPLVRDDVLSEMARDSASFELLSNSEQAHLGYDEHIEIHGDILGENIVGSSYPAQVSLREDDFMDHGGSPGQAEAYQRYMMEDHSYFDLHDREELQYAGGGIDTEFLNDDDDDLTETADDHIPDDGEARFVENTGWSSRTRAVSKYLQTLFVKEADCGRKSLSMDKLLVGKSRKEASRMFFEALVLKTRDYVHVEQPNAFDEITIKPRTRLMKSDF